MIERTFDAEWFNALCNLPEVRPGLGPDSLGVIDVSGLISNPANFALRSKHGGFILQAHGAGFYSVHTQFSSEGRGGHAISAMKAGLDFMFTRTDAMRIFSHCPDDNPAALRLSQAGGAKPWFRKANDPLLGPGMVVAWDILDWATSADELEAEGHAFHVALEEAKMAAGSNLETHPDDPVHDRMVGAVSLMIKRGQSRKGVALYGLWAAAAGYAPITLLAENPPVVDVVDGVVTTNAASEMQILQVRKGVN